MALRETNRDYLAEILRPFSPLLPASLPDFIARLPETVSDDLLRFWAEAGVGLARGPSGARDATGAYFRAGMALLPRLDEASLRRWVENGRVLAGLAAPLAIAYFGASEAMLPDLPIREADDWAGVGLRLYRSTPKSLALAAKFYALSPLLRKQLPLRTVVELGQVTTALAGHSVDHAAACLDLAPVIAESLSPPDCSAFLHFAAALVAVSWTEVKAYFQRGPELLRDIEPFQRASYLELATRAAAGLGNRAFRLFAESALALEAVRTVYHGGLIELAGRILPFSAPAAMSFLKNTPFLTGRLSMAELELWHAAGIETFLETGSGGESYFRLELRRAEEMIATVSARVDLAQVAHLLNMYSKALTGANLAVLPAAALADKGIGWVGEGGPSTEGSAIYLPDHIEAFQNKADNFSAYKVYATHQAGHLEFRSFEFAFARESSVFPARRALVEDRRRADSQGIETAALTDMERFFDLFPDRRLGADLFTLAEDRRVDACIQAEYRGLRAVCRRLKEAELKRRPNTFFLPLRQAFVENLLRASLDGKTSIGWPKSLAPLLLDAIEVLDKMGEPAATVEDAAEAALLLYDLAERVPNLPPGESGYLDWMSIAELEEGGMLTRDPLSGISGFEVPYESLDRVELYGDFKPEMVQLLLRVRGADNSNQDPGLLTAEQISAALEKSVEVSLAAESSVTAVVENLQQEATGAQDEVPGTGLLPAIAAPQRSAPSHKTSHYSEWDFRAADYRPRWCTVHERPMDEGSDEFFVNTLAEHADLVRETQRYFELMKPEPFRKVKRLEDGEDVDIDAAIEFIGQKKAGRGENAKIYWRHDKAERQVAVAVLVDMSSSTDARIEKQHWPPKRIIDLEKESLVLLTSALEVIGDRYGVFGFSGAGRHNVEYCVIKDFEEAFSPTIRRRIDGIAPVDSTRMGAAIRHTTTKLLAVEARTRILFLVSDGRPQDVDYGPEPGDRDYAIHDTHMALLEAKQKGITPFALTVDKEGHDYLGRMCGDMAYEVLGNIELLPSRLPALYRTLTA